MTRSQFATAHKELDLVFGSEFRHVTAEQSQLLCEDLVSLAEAEGITFGYAATLLHRRVYTGNLVAYAATLAAGVRRAERWRKDRVQAEGRVTR